MTDFDTFWRDHYPARLTRRGKLVRKGKGPAEDQWNRIIKSGKATPEGLCQAADGYAESEDQRYYVDCFRWLRDRGYEDFYGEAEKPYNQRPAATWSERDFEKAEWFLTTFGPEKFIRNYGFKQEHLDALRKRGSLQPRSVEA